MPRETVTPREGPFEVQVGWNQVGSVQLGVTVEGERSMFWELLGSNDEHLARLGEVVHLLGEEYAARKAAGMDETGQAAGRLLLDSLDARTPQYAGLWSDLGRQDINRLIRLLRKARDSAYGRDE